MCANKQSRLVLAEKGQAPGSVSGGGEEGNVRPACAVQARGETEAEGREKTSENGWPHCVYSLGRAPPRTPPLLTHDTRAARARGLPDPRPMFAALSTTPASLTSEADAVESVRILLVGNPGERRGGGGGGPHAFFSSLAPISHAPSPPGCGKSTLAHALATGKPPSRPPPQTAGCTVWVRVSHGIKKKRGEKEKRSAHDDVFSRAARDSPSLTPRPLPLPSQNR